MDKRSLLAEIEADEDEHIALLQAFIQAPSPNPPGDTVHASKVIQTYLEQRNIQYDIIDPQPHLPNIVSDFAGHNGDEGPKVVMNGHLDVFPPGDAAEWKYGPWSGINDGKYIHGRGGVDMKAGTAASAIAYAYLHKYQKELRGSVCFTAVSDEETGGKWGSRYLLDNEATAKRCTGDCMLNAEPGGLQSIRFGEKGTLRITFEVKGVGGHGAYVFRNEGANLTAVRLINRLLSIEQMDSHLDPALKEYLRRPEVQHVMDEIMGPGTSEAALRPTVNIGVLRGGLKVNMLAAQCTVEVDIRLPIGLATELVLEQIRKILNDFPQVSMEVQKNASNPASHDAPDHPVVEAIAKTASSVTGRTPLAIPSLGATDCKFWRYKGVPAYVFGPSPTTMGQTDERVAIQEYLAVIKTHTLAVWDYLGGS